MTAAEREQLRTDQSIVLDELLLQSSAASVKLAHAMEISNSPPKQMHLVRECDITSHVLLLPVTR